jgi:NADH-ubiquinone oxidoreductase chain 4
MAIVTLGIFSCSIIGIEGSIFLQLAHGLVSSALFIIVTVLYDRHHTRLVKYYRGITITMPVYSGIFLFFTLANIGAPLTCNFIGEFLCLLATYELNMFVGIMAGTGMILSAAYGLFLYNRVSFGSMSKYIESSPENRDINRREFYVLLPLIILTVVLGVYPNFIFDTMHASVANLVTYL